MAAQNAQIDENSRQSLIATGSSTQVTTRVYVDETTHALLVTPASGSTGDINVTKWGGATVTAASILADNATPATAPATYSSPILLNGIGNMERAKTVTSGFNNSSVGIPAAGMVAQFDDAATGSVNEDNFAVPRISSRRALLVEGVASGTNIPVSQQTASALNATVVQATGTNLHTVVDSGTITTVTSVTQNPDVRQSTASNLNAQVVGNVASAASDSGNPVKVGGVYNTTLPALTAGQRGDLQTDENGNLKVMNATLRAGEDLSANVQKVEHRFLPLLVTADTLVKTGAGVLHTISFAQNDATPTAGSIIIYDNTAESGTQLFNWNVQATAFTPFTVILDVSFTIGLYVGFTTTNDVNVTVSYR